MRDAYILLTGIGFFSGVQGSATVHFTIAICVIGLMTLFLSHGLREKWYIRLTSSDLQIRDYKTGMVETFPIIQVHSARISEDMELGAYEGAALKRCLVIQTELGERRFELPILNSKMEKIVEEISNKMTAVNMVEGRRGTPFSRDDRSC